MSPNHAIDEAIQAMGIEIYQVQLGSRPDGQDFGSRATHWRVHISRKGHGYLETVYSMGSAHKGLPQLADVLSCLLSDASSARSHSFGEWCDEFGYDTDSRKALAAYESCEKTADALRDMLNSHEIETLENLYENY